MLYYSRFEDYAPYLVRKRVGLVFKVIARFRTIDAAEAFLAKCEKEYPGIYFDIKDVSFSHLD